MFIHVPCLAFIRSFTVVANLWDWNLDSQLDDEFIGLRYGRSAFYDTWVCHYHQPWRDRSKRIRLNHFFDAHVFPIPRTPWKCQIYA